MIRPLDMQVALHALPEHAKQTSAENAGVLYKQVQEMGRARLENLMRQERPMELEARSETVFRPIEGKHEGEKDAYSSRNRRRSVRNENDRGNEEEIYAPQGVSIFRKAQYEEKTGFHLDLTA